MDQFDKIGGCYGGSNGLSSHGSPSRLNLAGNVPQAWRPASASSVRRCVGSTSRSALKSPPLQDYETEVPEPRLAQSEYCPAACDDLT